MPRGTRDYPTERAAACGAAACHTQTHKHAVVVVVLDHPVKRPCQRTHQVGGLGRRVGKSRARVEALFQRRPARSGAELVLDLCGGPLDARDTSRAIGAGVALEGILHNLMVRNEVLLCKDRSRGGYGPVDCLGVFLPQPRLFVCILCGNHGNGFYYVNDHPLSTQSQIFMQYIACKEKC